MQERETESESKVDFIEGSLSEQFIEGKKSEKKKKTPILRNGGRGLGPRYKKSDRSITMTLLREVHYYQTVVHIDDHTSMQ